MLAYFGTVVSSFRLPWLCDQHLMFLVEYRRGNRACTRLQLENALRQCSSSFPKRYASLRDQVLLFSRSNIIHPEGHLNIHCSYNDLVKGVDQISTARTSSMKIPPDFAGELDSCRISGSCQTSDFCQISRE